MACVCVACRPYWPSSLGRCSVSPSPSSVIGSLQTSREMKVSSRAQFLPRLTHRPTVWPLALNNSLLYLSSSTYWNRNASYINVLEKKKNTLNWTPQETVIKVSINTALNGWRFVFHFYPKYCKTHRNEQCQILFQSSDLVWNFNMAKKITGEKWGHFWIIYLVPKFHLSKLRWYYNKNN